VMCQIARGLEGTTATEAGRQLERLKWFLWHGNVFRALQVVGDLEMDLDVDGASPGQRKPRGTERQRRIPGTPRKSL
jgi:hypothetical protein